MDRHAEQLVALFTAQLVREGMVRADAETRVRQDLKTGRLLYDPARSPEPRPPPLTCLGSG